MRAYKEAERSRRALERTKTRRRKRSASDSMSSCGWPRFEAQNETLEERVNELFRTFDVVPSSKPSGRFQEFYWLRPSFRPLSSGVLTNRRGTSQTDTRIGPSLLTGRSDGYLGSRRDTQRDAPMARRHSCKPTSSTAGLSRPVCRTSRMRGSSTKRS